MTRVLFVDDEINILKGLERQLRPMRGEWEMSFAAGPREAITLFDKTPFDVVVTDMRMPEMTGTELLERIRGSHPAVARIVLSGHSKLESAVRSAGIAHQFLAKPCDAAVLRQTIVRVLALRKLLQDDELARLVAGIGTLPSLPASYKAINDELNAQDPSLQRVVEIVTKDIAMSAKVLQLVNSAFFGLARRVETIEQAVRLLGTEIIKSLVVSNAAFSQFEPAAKNFSQERLWQHSVAVGSIAAAIAKTSGADKTTIGETLQAALLHDIGQLILAAHKPLQLDAAIAAASSRKSALHDAEMEMYASTHAHVGAYLLGLWGLPDNAVEAVAFHHAPEPAGLNGFAPLIAVHAANALYHQAVDGPEAPEGVLNMEALTAAHCDESVAEWRETAEELLEQTAAA